MILVLPPDRKSGSSEPVESWKDLQDEDRETLL
jgi:hypothetical protein